MRKSAESSSQKSYEIQYKKNATCPCWCLLPNEDFEPRPEIDVSFSRPQLCTATTGHEELIQQIPKQTARQTVVHTTAIKRRNILFASCFGTLPYAPAEQPKQLPDHLRYPQHALPELVRGQNTNDVSLLRAFTRARSRSAANALRSASHRKEEIRLLKQSRQGAGKSIREPNSTHVQDTYVVTQDTQRVLTPVSRMPRVRGAEPFECTHIRYG